MNKDLLYLFLTLWVSSSALAQKLVRIHVVESQSMRSVSFAKVSVADTAFIADISGGFSVNIPENEKLLIERFPYENYTLHSDSIFSDTFTVELKKNNFHTLDNEDNNANEIIKQVQANKQKSNPHSYAPFHYTTYNKFFIATDQISHAKNFADKFVQSLSLINEHFQDDHLILLTESTTERRYLNKLCEDEIVTASKVSGVNKPLLLTMNSQLLPFSFYENYIKMGGKNYTNPLAGNPLKIYNFKCIDTTNHIATLIFSPKKNTRFDGMKGILFIDLHSMGIYKAIYYPAKEAKNLNIELSMECRFDEKWNIWFPAHVKNNANIENIGNKLMQFFASASTVYNDIQTDTSFQKNSFNEYAIKYKTNTDEQTEGYWNEHRKLELSKEDANTYTFYDSLGNIKDFENLVYTGERIMYKKIPYKVIDFDLRKILKINEFEGLRLGIGVETNERFHKNIRLGSYFGYGFKDKLFKYGGNASYLFDDKLQSKITVTYTNDVHESGAHNYFMDKYQYSSEWLRKLRIEIMEQVRSFSFYYTFSPMKFTYIQTGIEQNQNLIFGNYRFINLKKNTYNYLEFKTSLHIQYGQRYLKLLHDKYPFEQVFPHFWLEYTKGIALGDVGDFDYHKLEFKFNYNHKFLNMGTSGIELTGGFINRSLPYYKLFNGKGSSQIRTIAHNSFETMGYNEFYSDKYMALFYSHDFGHWNFFHNPKFRPRLEIAYNVGLGGLTMQQNHRNIYYKAFDKVYMEAGFLINNIISIHIAAIKVGFGLGFYHRFGSLANDTFIDNSFLKIATSFKL